MKKEVNKQLTVNFVIGLFKIIVSFICNSYTLIVSAIYDLEQIIILLFNKCSKENNSKGKSIITALINFIIVLGTMGFIYFSFISNIKVPSLFILLFVIIFVMIKYSISTFMTNIAYTKKHGIIGISTCNSSIDFYNYGVIIIIMIIGKLSKWFKICKYADKVGVLLISGLVIYTALKNIYSSFKCMSDKNITIEDEIKYEIKNRKEVKALDDIKIKYSGGYSYVTCDIALADGLNLVDVSTFMVTITDYLLKISDLVVINMTNATRKIKTVKRVKANAGNSRSRNSKTNTKKKNTKKANKKR